MKKIFTYYLKPFYLRMAWGFVLKFIGTLMDLFLPWTLAHMIDVVIPANRREDILLWGGFMLVCSVMAVTFSILANRMASRVSGDAIYVIREDLYAKVMYLSNRQADEFTRPSLISRLTSDTYYVQQMLTRVQRLGVRAPILLIGGIVMTMLLDVPLACVLLTTLPLLAAVVVLVSRKSIPMFARLQESADRFVRLVREDIAGIRVIKALSKEEYERNRFDQINREVVERERKATVITAITNPVMNILLNLGLVGVIILGAYRVDHGLTEVGKILAFMTYFTIILNALLSISRMFVVLSKGTASAQRISEVLDAEDERAMLRSFGEQAEAAGQETEGACREGEAAGQETKGTCRGNEGAREGTEGTCREVPKAAVPHIEFEHVCFSYNKVEDNLHDISFSLMHGETLGIIGATGSGKTTAANLLMRFYDVDQGRILVDGQDIRGMDLRNLRKRFGAVFQNDVLFKESIYENIRMGRDITQEQAMEAALYARAKDFVEEKGGMAENIDIRGANLSGGQKQRILIARALAAHPEILILDDSSSALDYQTDAALRKGLREHFADTTCILIAQRMNAVMHADHILVLEDGEMAGYGTHEELIKTCEVYREIGKSQMGI